MIKMIISLIEIRDCLIKLHVFSSPPQVWLHLCMPHCLCLCGSKKKRMEARPRVEREWLESNSVITHSSFSHHWIITQSSFSHHSDITLSSFSLQRMSWVTVSNSTTVLLPTWLQWSDVTFVCWRSFIVTRDKNYYYCWMSWRPPLQRNIFQGGE